MVRGKGALCIKNESMPNHSIAPQQSWSTHLGLSGLLLFSFTAWLSTAPAYLALLLMLIALLMEAPLAWKTFRHQPITWVTLALVGYIYLRAALAAHEIPELAEEQWQYAERFAILSLFLLVAYWLARCPDKLNWVLALALTGIIVGLILNQDWSKWELMLQGKRSGSEKWWYSIMGLYAATALLGLILFTPCILTRKSGHLLSALSVLIWSLCIAILSHALIVSQSRTVWLACLLAFPPILFFFARNWLKDHPDIPRVQLAIGSSLGLLVLAGVFAANIDTISQRAQQERAVYEGITKLDDLSTTNVASAIPKSSFGARFWLLSYGLEVWKERPLLGWGPGTSSTQYLAPKQDRRDLQPFWHLHNSYMEILCRFGLIGGALFLSLAVLILRGGYLAYQNGKLPHDLYLLLAGSIALLLIWGLTDVRLDKHDYRVYWYFFAGLAYFGAMRLSLNKHD
jgi:O-antigen ligase